MSDRINTDIGSIPIDWKAVKFDDYAELKHGHQFRTYDFTDDGIKVFKITQIKANGETDLSNCDYVDIKRLNEFINFKINKGDILVALTGATIGKISRFWVDETVLQNYRVGSFFSKNEEVLSKEFLYQFLRSNYFFFQIIARQTQSAQQNIGKEEINNMTLFLPNINEQKAIANILTSFDNKIELLKAQNKTLEETAQTIFMEWFGKYQIGDELPEGWRVGKLGEVGNIICGKTPSKSNTDFYGNEIPFIKIPDMHNKMFILETTDNLSIEGALSQNNKMLPKNSICISCIATVGLVSITTKKSQTNQQINSIIPKRLSYREYLYFALTSMKEYLNDLGSGGTATLNVNTSTFSNLELIIPSEPILQEFHRTQNPFFEKILYNNTQIQTLTQARDELLPKLMSGEIRVNEFDR